MDNRPIGIFDSGLGGLTCGPALRKALPNESFLYFGDTARTPYGSKDPATIREFSAQIAGFLVSQNVKMIVIACNTVSSTCLTSLRTLFPKIPFVGIIKPAADAIRETCSPGESVGIIGTKATVASGVYEKFLAGSGVKLALKACPAFVPLIEEGLVDTDIMRLTIRHYLDDFLAENGVSTLLLACTHYPLIEPDIRNLYPSLRILNSSETIVMAVEAELKRLDLLADGSAAVKDAFYASDLSENFLNMINRISASSDFRVAFHHGF